jgi:nucleotide-binding universal stress UspA family protein
MIKRILVGLAGTTYTDVAIERAVTLAQAHAAEVTGVTVLDRRRVRSVGEAAPWEDAETNRDLRQAITESHIARSIRTFEGACVTAQIKHRVVEETGNPFSKLVDLSRYHDLMIFGLRSVFESDFSGGPPQELLMQLISAGVRPIIAVSEKFRPISRVLIAYNGSMEAAKAMKRFVQMRLWPGAQIKVVTFHPSADLAYELLVAAEGYCRAHGYHVEHQSNPGQAKDLLLSAATMWRADMIVMGNSARSILLRRILGDTFLNVVSQSEVPLFLAQ